MNEIIKELAIKAGFPEWSNHAIEFELEQFAELIIEECCVALHPMLRDMISRGQGVDMIIKHFKDEERKGWVCPKCGIDRTKDVCPKGHFATMTGDCPMTATAQSGIEE